MYSSSDEEEALLLLALEDEEISRFVFLSDRCRSYINFFPRDMQNLPCMRQGTAGATSPTTPGKGHLRILTAASAVPFSLLIGSAIRPRCYISPLKAQ
jgi:hypothetical protein